MASFCFLEMNQPNTYNTGESLSAVASNQNRFYERNMRSATQATSNRRSPVLQRRRPDEPATKSVASNTASCFSMQNVSHPSREFDRQTKN